MNITINIKDDFTGSFVSASKWKINRTDLDDDTSMKRCLKQSVGNIIDEYFKYMAYGSDEISFNTLHKQFKDITQQYSNVKRTYEEKRDLFNSSFTPINMEDTGSQ